MEIPVFKVLFAATGSVAAMKIPILIKHLLEQSSSITNYKFEVHLMVTNAAKRFFSPADLPAEAKFYDDEMADQMWQKVGDPVLHVELATMADMLVVAPLTANTLTKVAQGLSDNLVTITIRCWPPQKPLLFCPSMSTRMWEHPVTAQHIANLKQWGFIEIPPVFKKLMCGTVGVGGMAEVETILQVIVEIANKVRSSSNPSED